MRAGQLGVLVKYTSRLEGNNLVSNWMNLNHVSNNKHCKYNCVVLSSFGQTNQLTTSYHQHITSVKHLGIFLWNLTKKFNSFILNWLLFSILKTDFKFFLQALAIWSVNCCRKMPRADYPSTKSWNILGSSNTRPKIASFASEEQRFLSWRTT